MTDLPQVLPGAVQPTLATPRLRLRPLRPADAAQIALHAADPRVARMTVRIPHPYPPGAAEALVEKARKGEAEGLIWALDTGADDENGLIGMIRVTPRGDGTAAIGYWVAPAVWGAGYASEALEAIRTWASGEGLAALTAEVFQDNLASVKVLTRAGFAYLGETEAYSLARQAMVPSFRYRLDLAAAQGR